MNTLTDIERVHTEKMSLTNKTSAKFVISFKYKLYKNYTFLELQLRDNRKLQKFLDKITNMTYQQVEDSYRRENDKNDKFRGVQVIHYGYDDLRLHGILEDGYFVVIRIDPYHKFHS